MFFCKNKLFFRYLSFIFLMLPLTFGIFLFPRPVSAAGDLSNLAISATSGSSTKYFYDQKPYVTGSISSSIDGMIVTFDNISNDDDYFVAVSQSYPATSFTTLNDCFSSKLNHSACPNDIPAGTYRVSAEAFRDVDVSQKYVFPKYLAKIPLGSAVDKTELATPVSDNVAGNNSTGSSIVSNPTTDGNNQAASPEAVKGVSDKTDNGPSKTLMIILYISIGLLILTWGMYFIKRFYKHRGSR